MRTYWLRMLLVTQTLYCYGQTPEQMKAKANTTSEQSNEKSMEIGDPCMAEMRE